MYTMCGESESVFASYEMFLIFMVDILVLE